MHTAGKRRLGCCLKNSNVLYGFLSGTQFGGWTALIPSRPVTKHLPKGAMRMLCVRQNFAVRSGGHLPTRGRTHNVFWTLLIPTVYLYWPKTSWMYVTCFAIVSMSHLVITSQNLYHYFDYEWCCEAMLYLCSSVLRLTCEWRCVYCEGMTGGTRKL